MEHYRCITGWFPKSKRSRICETVTFFPHSIPFPKITLDEHLKQATSTIIDILTKQTSDSSNTPLLDIEDKTNNGLLKLAKILNHHADNIPQFNSDLPSSAFNQTQKDISNPLDSQATPSSAI